MYILVPALLLIMELPKKKIIIGKNSFISAGTIVNKDVPENSKLIGSQRLKNVT